MVGNELETHQQTECLVPDNEVRLTRQSCSSKLFLNDFTPASFFYKLLISMDFIMSELLLQR
jgi:hypothetical protein